MGEGTSTFDATGYAVIPDIICAHDCELAVQQFALDVPSGPGTRTLLAAAWCRDLADAIRRSPLIKALLPADPRAVQCTYFEKSPSQNWLVTLHQDLSIPVRERVDSEACSAWSEKEGVLFVQPPTAVLDSLVAVRLHLDDSSLDAGPLRVVPGSHRRGRLGAAEAQALRDASGEVTCLVPRGGVLVMKPLLLHASSKAHVEAFRRVLHFVFGPPDLPHGLSWRTAV